MIKLGNKFFVSFEDINFLFQELQNAWMTFEIPSFHQEIFKSFLEFVEPAKVPHVIAKEIDLVESCLSPVQKTLASIEKREFLIGKLTTFKRKTENFNGKDWESVELEAAYSIVEIRKVTAAVIKSVSHWKEQFYCLNCEFYWNNINYIDKIKHDLNFLKALGRFHFVMRDPFFLSMDSSKICIKARLLIKTSPAQIKKLKKLEKILNYEMPDIKSIKLSRAQVVNKELESIFKQKILTKAELEKLEKENLSISDQIFNTLLNNITEKLGQETLKTQLAKKELSDLSELLYENCVLDMVHKESNEYFLDLLKMHSEVIFQGVTNEVLNKFTQFCICEPEFLAHNIACDLCDCINFTFLVKPCVNEIVEENNEIAGLICETVLEDIIVKPWVLNEIQQLVNILRVKKFFKGFSLGEMGSKHRDELEMLLENMVEEICIGIICKYPGKKWLKSIVKFSFEEVRGEDEPDLKTLMPIKL